MTALQTAGLYIGLLILLMSFLKLNVGRVRIKNKITLGDGDNDEVYRAIRVQGNAVEDVPMVMFGLLALALLGATTMFIHIVGGAFLFGRLAHAHGLSSNGGSGIGRTLGTIISMLALLVTAIGTIYYAVAGGGLVS